MDRLGPFQILDVLGRGASGLVYRAVHVRDGVGVALKVLTTDVARQPMQRAMLRREVRAVASLEHPGIIHIVAHGRAERDRGPVVAGCPWFATELASGGTLADLDPSHLDWSELRDLLLALLDALAHAHARGVVHRDLKPSNVLLCTEDDFRPGPKIADFGIAQAVDAHLASMAAMGTPRFMAPEQQAALGREQGPWTDLFSLGCVAWHLCTGTPPFPPYYYALTGSLPPLPDLEPLFAVPRAFRTWLSMMLAAEPSRRFAHAADAAWALMGVDEGDMAPQAASHTPTERPQRSDPVRTTTVVDPVAACPGLIALRGVKGADRTRPPVPPDWRPGPTRGLPPRLTGVGLSLYGLRRLPFVGRQHERDFLWTRFRSVTAGGPRAVVISGAAGMGKSSVARWLCERASEVGAATVMKAHHERIAGPTDGISLMLIRHLKCGGLAAVETELRLSEGGLGEEAAAVARLAGTEGGLTSAGRVRIVGRVTRRMAEARPVIVWLDDVQWGPEALALTSSLCASDAPILVVLTVREEALPGRPREAERLDELLRLAESERLPLHPLDSGERRALVRESSGGSARGPRLVPPERAGQRHRGPKQRRQPLQPGPDGH